MTKLRFADAPLGILRHAACDRKQRHCHDDAFAAVIISGGYQEAGDEGRWNVAAGDVVLHRPFESHVDYFRERGAEVLIVSLPANLSDTTSMVGSVADPDVIVRLARSDPRRAELALEQGFVPSPVPILDWPDLLANELRLPGRLMLSEWADKMGLRAETISRGFRSAYGCSPKAYRAAARARAAFSRIQNGGSSLTSIAHDLQFADQAHMTRAVSQLTNAPPSRWRLKSSGFKTADTVMA